MTASDDAPAPGVFRAARALLCNLVELAHTRVELLGAELHEEAARLLLVMVFSLAGVCFAAMAIAFAGVAVLIAAWDSHRLAAALAIAVVFAGLAAAGMIGARRVLFVKPRLLDATLSELEKDCAELRPGP